MSFWTLNSRSTMTSGGRTVPSAAVISSSLAAHFMTITPDQWLVQYPRFLRAIEVRLGKPGRDPQKLAEISPFWQGYLERSKRHREQHIHDPELETFRWMIEELRVSLFAQELKTSIPVSVKRLEKQWEKVRK